MAIIEGFDNIEIHNDAGSMRIDKEVTLFTLFQGLNSLPKKFIEQGYEIVYECCNLTERAKNNFEIAKTEIYAFENISFCANKDIKAI